MPTETEVAGFRLEVRRQFAAPRERVFDAWTNPEALLKWFRPSPTHSIPVAEVDLRVGGHYRFEMVSDDGVHHAGSGTYEEIVRPERLVFTWEWADSRVQPEPSRLILEFRQVGSGTELVLIHERLSSQESIQAHGYGWKGCLDSLATYLDEVNSLKENRE